MASPLGGGMPPAPRPPLQTERSGRIFYPIRDRILPARAKPSIGPNRTVLLPEGRSGSGTTRVTGRAEFSPEDPRAGSGVTVRVWDAAGPDRWWSISSSSKDERQVAGASRTELHHGYRPTGSASASSTRNSMHWQARLSCASTAVCENDLRQCGFAARRRSWQFQSSKAAARHCSFGHQ